MFSQTITKLKEDLTEKENIIKNETVTKVGVLKAEMNQSKLSFETKIKAIENEKEREINRVYVRYKFPIAAFVLTGDSNYVVIVGHIFVQGQRGDQTEGRSHSSVAERTRCRFGPM